MNLTQFAEWLIEAYHSDDGMPEAKEICREARAALSAQPVAGAVAEPCNLCNALTVPRNATHYDAEDLSAASVRAKLMHKLIPVEAAPAPEPSAQPVAGAVAEPDCWAILTPNGSKLVSPDEAKGRKDAYPLYAAPQPQAAPAPEPSRSQKMHEAGFTARDTRLTCDECGAKFTRQFAPLHECAQPEPSAQGEPVAVAEKPVNGPVCNLQRPWEQQ